MRIASAVLLAAVLGLAACGPDPAAQVAPATPAVTPAIYQARTDAILSQSSCGSNCSAVQLDSDEVSPTPLA